MSLDIILVSSRRSFRLRPIAFAVVLIFYSLWLTFVTLSFTPPLVTNYTIVDAVSHSPEFIGDRPDCVLRRLVYETGFGWMGELRCGFEVWSTLEREFYLIPPGIYPIEVRRSPRWRIMAPYVTEVLGRRGVAFHPGMRQTDSAGCILVSKEMFPEVRSALKRSGRVLIL